MAQVRYVQAIVDALREEMERNDRVFIMGEDVGRHGGAFRATAGLYEIFGPERVRDTPISESAIVGAGIGAALTGMRPVVELQFSDFVTECMDQIVNQLAKVRYMSGGQVSAPLVIRMPGGRSHSEAAQHSQSLESWFISVPGLFVVMPSTPEDAKGLLKSALRGNNPVLFFEHKLLYRTVGEVPDGDYELPFGQAVIRRKGKDLTLVSASWMSTQAVAAAEALARDGIDVEVIDVRTLVPMDIMTILDSVQHTRRVIIAHEAPLFGGWGAEVASQISENASHRLKCPPRRIGARFAPIPMAPAMENYVLPSADWIIEEAKRVVAS